VKKLLITIFFSLFLITSAFGEKIQISDNLRKIVNGDKVKYQILYQIPSKGKIWLQAVPIGDENAATEGKKVSGMKLQELKFIELIISDGYVVSKKGLSKAAREQKKAHTIDKKSSSGSGC
jgi:hypothetical protein|tara:strand:+ start:180 stop:542 length:363 start_codon:yes stop_codon:yes gene_type:complete